MFYTIKEVADILDISAYTLRYYEKEGIFPPIQRSANGNREYSLKDLQWIYLIVCLRETGMSLQEIKKYIALTKEGTDTVSKRYRMLLKQKELAYTTIENIKSKILILEEKLSFYQKIMEDGEVADDWNPAFSVPKPHLQERLDKLN